MAQQGRLGGRNTVRLASRISALPRLQDSTRRVREAMIDDAMRGGSGVVGARPLPLYSIFWQHTYTRTVTSGRACPSPRLCCNTAKFCKLLRQAAKALGHMARTPISSSSEDVEFEISQALEVRHPHQHQTFNNTDSRNDALLVGKSERQSMR